MLHHHLGGGQNFDNSMRNTVAAQKNSISQLSINLINFTFKKSRVQDVGYDASQTLLSLAMMMLVTIS